MRILPLLTMVVALAAVVLLPATASANLPKKPACSDLSYSLFGPIFGTTPTATQTRTSPRNIITHQPQLGCEYTGPSFGVEVLYDHGTKGTALAYYRYQEAWNRKHEAGVEGLVQTLTPVAGLGDAAYLFYNDCCLMVLDGADVVTIKHGVGPEQAGPNAQAIEALAMDILRLA